MIGQGTSCRLAPSALTKTLPCVQMCHGLDASLHDGTVVAGDNRGRLHFLDPRQAKPFAAAAVHKKDKVPLGGPKSA